MSNLFVESSTRNPATLPNFESLRKALLAMMDIYVTNVLFKLI